MHRNKWAESTSINHYDILHSDEKKCDNTQSPPNVSNKYKALRRSNDFTTSQNSSNKNLLDGTVRKKKLLAKNMIRGRR